MSTPTEPTPAASTDRQQAEAVLRRNAEALAALVEQSPLGIYTVDSQFRVRNVSAGAMPAFRNVQPLVGRDFAEVMRILWPESFASEAIRIFRRTLQTGEPYVSPGLTEKRNDIGAIESYEWQVNRVTLADGLPGVVCYYFDTTRLQQAHQAARESEERFRTFISATSNVVYRMSPDWSEMRYLNGKEFIADTKDSTRTWFDKYIHPEDQRHVMATIQRAIQSRTIFELEHRVIRADGSLGWIYSRAIPILDEHGEIREWFGAVSDATQRKHAEEALRKSEERLRLAQQVARVGSFEWNIQENISRWSPELEALYGLSPGEFGGTYEAWAVMVHPEDLPSAEQTHREALENGSLEAEWRVVWPDGTIRWLAARGQLFKDETGKPLRMIGVNLDITASKKAEAALREQRDRADFVADASDVGFWFCDLPFDKLIWDKRVKNHFWLSADADVTIHKFYECLHPEDLEPTRHAIEKSIATNTQYDIEYRTLAPDGKQNWVRAIGRTFYDAGGRPTRFDGITLNVTARKQFEVALSASEARYRVLAESLDQQVQARTLELRARNQEILRMYESLRTLSTRMMAVQDEERRRIARDLHDSAGQLLVAIDIQLTALAHDLRKAAPQFNEQTEETESLVQQLHKEIRTTSYLLHPPLLDEAGLYSALSWYVEGLNKRSAVRVSLEIAADFGRLPRDIELVAFRLVQESLANIYRHSGSKTAAIRIARDEGTITLEVQDQGKGIPPEKLAQIQSEGSGVGIRGMRERLRQFGGELRIDSGACGTCVFVTIPICQTPVSREPNGFEPMETAV
jgi:PAS domain S-box-containing protein